jgi:RNA polymerase sigma-70 factor (ECF subfamily)
MWDVRGAVTKRGADRCADETESLYDQYGPMMFRRIRRFFPEPDAEEVLHDLFIKLLTDLDAFRAAVSPAAWLYRVTTNHCLNELRLGRRRRDLLLQHGDPFVDQRTEPIDAEASTFLRDLWQKLPAELLAIGVYYHVDGLSHEQIAGLVGVSRRTIGARLEQLAALARKEIDRAPRAPRAAARGNPMPDDAP